MKISTIFLMLGDKCNFNCRYCIQNEVFSIPLPDKVDDRVLDLINSMEPHEPFNDNTKKRNNRILVQFYGGEPLLYFEAIKHAVSRLDASKFTYAIISNGALLTQEIVDFVNANNMHFCVSNDGAASSDTRRRDVLLDKEFLRLYNQIKHRAANAIVTANNYKIGDIYDHISGVLGNDIYVGFDFVMDTGCLPQDLKKFDFDSFERYYDDYFSRLFKKLCLGSLSSNEYEFIMSFVNKVDNFNKNGFKTEPKCGTVTRMLNIDIRGNAYLCHNCGIKLGNALEEDYQLIVERYEPYNVYASSQQCKGCRAYPICSGGCILVDNSARSEYYCEMYNRLWNCVDKFCRSLKALGMEVMR